MQRRYYQIGKYTHEIEIRHVCEHYEGYVDGEFVVSRDTYHELEKDLEEVEVK